MPEKKIPTIEDTPKTQSACKNITTPHWQTRGYLLFRVEGDELVHFVLERRQHLGAVPNGAAGEHNTARQRASGEIRITA